MSDSTQAEDEQIAALRKCKVDGSLYVRPAEIDRLLNGLIILDENEVLARAAIRRRSAAGWLPGECLIHMMRRAGRRRDRRSYNRWCALVLERIRATLPRDYGDTASARDLEIADYALDRFVGLLGPDLEAYEERLDIWEARFDLALANLRRDAFRRGMSADTTGETVEIGDDAGLLLEVERALGAFDPFDPAREADDDFRSRIWTAIDALPTEQNRILTMMRAGIPIGSGTSGENSISGILGKTPRTILNQKLRAFTHVRHAVLGDER